MRRRNGCYHPARHPLTMPYDCSTVSSANLSLTPNSGVITGPRAKDWLNNIASKPGPFDAWRKHVAILSGTLPEGASMTWSSTSFWNFASLEQYGRANSGDVVQNGAGLSVESIQTGSGLEYSLTQTGCAVARLLAAAALSLLRKQALKDLRPSMEQSSWV